MGHVYLLKEMGREGYKIGSTNAKDVNGRIKQLQTGNSTTIYLKNKFETDKPFKLETMLHNRFRPYQLNGEWFDLCDDDVNSFEDICQNYQNIIDSLVDNPFFH